MRHDLGPPPRPSTPSRKDTPPFHKYLKSPIGFYQMVGRGTRIDAPTGKLMFRVYDYTDATRLFGEGFITKPPRTGGGDTEPPSSSPPPEATIRVEGFDVHITDAERFIVADVDGRAMPVPLDEYKARLAARLVQEVRTLDDFRARWIDPPSRQELIDTLVTSGYSPTLVRMVDDKQDYDLYDVLAELGWGMNPRTRNDRTMAFTYKHEDWINALPPQAAATIRAIASQFERGGTEGIAAVCHPNEGLQQSKAETIRGRGLFRTVLQQDGPTECGRSKHGGVSELQSARNRRYFLACFRSGFADL